MKLSIQEEYDYRTKGIPYEERKELQSQGYEMDASAVVKSIKVGQTV